MIVRRPEPSQSDSPSVSLLRAIGDLQLTAGGEFIEDMDAVIRMCAVLSVNVATLTAVGITVGYLEEKDRTIGLAAKGQRWYERDLLRRD